MSPDSGINELQGLSLEEQEKQKEEWQQELNKVEEEIKTLREVLGSKVKASQELRRKLGYTVWQEISEDVSQSLRNVKESNVLVVMDYICILTAYKTQFIFFSLAFGLFLLFLFVFILLFYPSLIIFYFYLVTKM